MRHTGPHSLETRQKIALSKTKYTQAQAFDQIEKYIDAFNDPNTAPAPTPSLSGLAVFMGISLTTLYRLVDNNPDLRDSIDFIRTVQEDRLTTGALVGALNAKFAAFILERRLGYSTAPSSLVQNNNITANLSPDLLASALAAIK